LIRVIVRPASMSIIAPRHIAGSNESRTHAITGLMSTRHCVFATVATNGDSASSSSTPYVLTYGYMPWKMYEPSR
jgi:hypothetical protein